MFDFTNKIKNFLQVIILGGVLFSGVVSAQQNISNRIDNGNQQISGQSNRNINSQSIEQTDADFWSKPRRLHLVRRQTGESVNVIYYQNGKLDIDGYNKINWLMRDLSVNKAVQMDPRLLDLLCAMQAWVSYYGYKKPFIITSGYRTEAYNRRLKGSARNSMHIQGKAVDIVFPDLPVGYMGRLAQDFSGGGVGFYPSNGFVHVDTGRIRTWRK